MTKAYRQGFTLVEMTIAIAFLAVLMLAILSLTLTAGKLYIKGDTNKTINQAGRDFADTIRRDFLSTGTSLVSPVVIVSGGSGDAPIESGRICLGTVAYLWNTAALLNADTAAANAAKVTMGSSNQPINFVRIVRPQQTYCDPNMAGIYPMNIPATETAREMFDGQGRDYALHVMTIARIAESGDKGLYNVRYTLGTNDLGSTEVEDGTVRCRTNDNVAANFDYCSVSDFDMMVRIGGTR